VKKQKLFETEAAMCACFLRAIPDTWTAYAETAGWDILLVRKRDGFQVGIQAKLRLNTSVFTQAIEYGHQATRPGPDCRAVMVPWGDTSGWREIAAYIGSKNIKDRDVTQSKHSTISWNPVFEPTLPDDNKFFWSEPWHELLPVKRHELPEFVPDVAAGASAPVQLTKWKIAAIKLDVLLERRGFITRKDFKDVGIDHRRWVTPGFEWIISDGAAKLNDRVYKKGPRFPDLKMQHPRVWDEIAEKVKL